MAEKARAPHSLKDQNADQIRNEQRGGNATPADPGRDPGPEGNATLRRVWSEPGGEAMSYRSSRVGAGAEADDHSDLTAQESPEAARHLDDATITPEQSAATADAIGRATAVTGEERKASGDKP